VVKPPVLVNIESERGSPHFVFVTGGLHHRLISHDASASLSFQIAPNGGL